MKISDCFPGLQAKLANRSDLTPDMPRWIADAVLELTQSYSFEELREVGPMVQFLAGVNNYPEQYFLKPPPPPPAPVILKRITQIISWFVELDPQSHVGFELKYRVPAIVKPTSEIIGVPCMWTRVGGKLYVAFTPQQNYNTQLTYQYNHPFSAVTPNGNEPILMPDEWREVVEYAAAERAAIEKRMIDYADNFHNVLFGDPDFRKSGGTRGAPGLIFKRTSQFERDSSNNERRFVPVVARYGRR